jgi:hypothetical protein
MLDSTTEIRELFDRAIRRCDALLELYDHNMRGNEEIDISDDNPLRLQPYEVYDSCVVGYDANAGKYIYSERAVIFACMHEHDCTLDLALELLNAHVFPLGDVEGGPIFMSFGRIPAHSEAGPET